MTTSGEALMANATQAELEALRSRIGQILMSPQCQKINFTFDNVYIDGSSFSYVALSSLQKSGFKVQINATPVSYTHLDMSKRQI